jgi:hypothetical protein
LEDAKKRQRIDDFLYPFQVPSDFLFPIFFFSFLSYNFPSGLHNPPFRRKKSRLHAVFDIPLTRASRGLSLRRKKKGNNQICAECQVGEEQEEKKGMKRKKKKTKKKTEKVINSNKSRNSSLAPIARAPSFHERKRYE